jgi:hypothetical protein
VRDRTLGSAVGWLSPLSRMQSALLVSVLVSTIETRRNGVSLSYFRVLREMHDGENQRIGPHVTFRMVSSTECIGIEE